MKSCFFIGHREADERSLPKLESEIDRLIAEENVRYFYVVDTCHWLVCYVRHGAGNSGNLLKYAQRR